MAIPDQPETIATAIEHSTVRRRPTATSAGGLYNSPESTDSSGEDLVKDSGSDDFMDTVDSGVGYSQPPQKHENKTSVLDFAYRPSVPAHRRVKESPLSSDSIFHQLQSHAGLFNLCIVVLVAVNSRLIIENLMKYGFLIKSGFWFSSYSLSDWPLFMCCLSLVVFPFTAFLVEKLAQRKCIPESVVVLLHISITSASVLYPILVILRCDSAFLSGVTLMLLSCVVWLKLVSYAHTSYDMRQLTKSIEKGEAVPNTVNMDYPYSVSFKSLAYFMVAPTLCYQQSYPRTPYIRKGWVFRQVVKLIIFTGVMGFIIEQYINPIVQNSQHPFKGDLLYAIERVLKLSVPNLYVWLCMFYCFFHLWLNILAELLRFGDREFYKDWWNAKTVEDYWRMWNMPVHKWMIRHLYFPCLRQGIPKAVALLIAFLVSALFHELCIAVPCHIFKLWAFGGIMFQVPLVLITHHLQNKFRNSMVGNMIFWFIFSILGQPMCVLLYYHDLMNRKIKLDQS
ncbi:diacylglycerol O-acyltransferase 1A isoform X1 [Vigna radiata var. radiata]|uniref:O-acyltransferase n=1 Tax=Vigna radiata var. radiata TaxID=3916 RepID=A0A1S3UW46_VIGRR|nr:diacylglycerol O-acyltransferase 1A isoform X1 [Vigna radiata var. radiata]